MKTNKNTQRGFTLFEMGMVGTIMIIIALGATILYGHEKDQMYGIQLGNAMVTAANDLHNEYISSNGIVNYPTVGTIELESAVDGILPLITVWGGQLQNPTTQSGNQVLISYTGASPVSAYACAIMANNIINASYNAQGNYIGPVGKITGANAVVLSGSTNLSTALQSINTICSGDLAQFSIEVD